MLPSVRIIVATFLFGFLAVFAGLRIATMTRFAHETLPGPSAVAWQARPTSTAQAAAPEMPPAPPIASVPGEDPPHTESTATLAQSMPPAPPIASAPSDDPPPIQFSAPTQFSPGSVGATEFAIAPEPATAAPDVMPVPAELPPLSILPDIAALAAPAEELAPAAPVALVESPPTPPAALP